MDARQPQSRSRLRSQRRGWTAASVIGLLVLAPVSAEYLSAYDDTTGSAVALLAGLVIFVPLYGCPALVIREVARRYGLGWPGILLLGLTFGLLQAGVVDESLFNDDYRDIAGWEETYGSTLIRPLGLSVVNLLNFVGGHAVFSIAAPVALVEAARPRTAARPWLGRTGLALAVLGWLGASALVLIDSRRTEGPQASAVQLTLTCLLALGLVAAAVLPARRRTPVEPRRPPVGVPVVLGSALVLAYVQSVAPESWVGVAMVLGTDAVAVVGFVLGSCGAGWGARHVAAAALAALLVRVVLAFTYAPLVGQVTPAAALGHHVVMLGLVLVVGALALRPIAGGPSDGPSVVKPEGAGTKAG
ncbi:hypothetical protein [uncultured Friedmanniella sp.]|uniref:hypothetical protein n=1 Tax=uncultured Friedmanniella sp. TaxID=335381 RepID=UPI0035C9D33A